MGRGFEEQMAEYWLIAFIILVICVFASYGSFFGFLSTIFGFFESTTA